MQAGIAELFAQIPPFDFLTEAETGWLAQRTAETTAAAGEVLCDPGDRDYDALFIVSAGRIAVHLPGAYAAAPHQVRAAPTYFGEISVFFDQPRNARVTAYGPLKYYRLAGEDMRTLVRQNAIFRQAFASVLDNKQRIFHGYDTFVNRLTTQEASGVVQLRDLIEAYRGLRSILHQANVGSSIDFDALRYVLPRLPDHITSTFALRLVEDLPEAYAQVDDVLQAASQRARKRRFYKLAPGKSLVLLRDRLSDLIDLATKLCIYSVEMTKIRDRLWGHPATSRIAELAVRGHSTEAVEAVRAALPFSAQEIEQLQALLGGDLFTRLYEILVQDGQIALYIEPASNRYETTASERWRSQIRDALERVLRASGTAVADCDIHIISSNTHSVGNCLSAWLQQHADVILDWAAEHAPADLGQPQAGDRLYAAARPYFQAHPEAQLRRIRADEEQGLFTFDDTSFAGISLTLVDAGRLGAGLDLALGTPCLPRPTLIVNVDYAYGRQARLITQNLILLFGRQIRSVSVFGKAGAVAGRRGDILLPDQLIMQSSNEVYPLPNRDLAPADFAGLNFPQAIHQGTMLTVLGTAMQSNEMLRYYRTFWNVVGMEMEGAFYLRELLQARTGGLLAGDLRLRFAYYVSDTPLAPGASLATRLSPQEGVPAVYAITRAILKHILRPEG